LLTSSLITCVTDGNVHGFSDALGLLKDREQVALRLLEASAKHSFDPDRELDWDAPFEEGKWFWPPELVSLYDTPLWRRMPEPQRMDLGLKGRVALVAAASKGLGRATATELAREGASVIICARGTESLDRARREIVEATGADVRAVTADVSERTGIERLVSEAMQHFGRVDILVTNAGGPPAGTFDVHQWDAWQRAVDLTLRSVVELTRGVLPGMRERGWGRIVNVGSIATREPIPLLNLSNSHRMAAVGFFKTLSQEVGGDGITVNTVATGRFATERIVSHFGSLEAAEEAAAQSAPAGRLGLPAEYGDLVAFLCSERAAYITGTVIPIDGGLLRSV